MVKKNLDNLLPNYLSKDPSKVNSYLGGLGYGGTALLGLIFEELCIISKNKATLDKVSYGSGQKYSKELKNYSFTSAETIVARFTLKKCAKINIFHVFNHKSITNN